jgi:hypothetical protein
MMRLSLAAVLSICLVGVAYADEKEFVYVQKTGQFRLGEKEIAKGYSGHGEGKDNPDKEKVVGVGPIPAGLWTIGKARDFKGMKNCFDLSPDGHDAHKRSAFLIHGDSKDKPGTASRGCIILGPEVRKKIAESGVTRLRVVKE